MSPALSLRMSVHTSSYFCDFQNLSFISLKGINFFILVTETDSAVYEVGIVHYIQFIRKSVLRPYHGSGFWPPASHRGVLGLFIKTHASRTGKLNAVKVKEMGRR
jgi:hypothetical protein